MGDGGVPQLRHAEDHWGQLNRVYPEIPWLIQLNHEYPIKITISWGINPIYHPISQMTVRFFEGCVWGWIILANQTGNQTWQWKIPFYRHYSFLNVLFHESLKLLMFNCHVWLPEGTVFVGFKLLCSTDVLNLTGQQEKEGRVADGVEEAEIHAHEWTGSLVNGWYPPGIKSGNRKSPFWRQVLMGQVILM